MVSSGTSEIEHDELGVTTASPGACGNGDMGATGLYIGEPGVFDKLKHLKVDGLACPTFARIQ
jgi:hypothetical protein